MGSKLKPNSEVVFVANTSGSAVLPSGVPFEFLAGLTTVRGDHAILRQCPKFFEPVSPLVRFDTTTGKRYETL
jgi:hypothetical protein